LCGKKIRAGEYMEIHAVHISDYVMDIARLRARLAAADKLAEGAELVSIDCPSCRELLNGLVAEYRKEKQ
jgi:hypothetical protein